MGDLRLPPPTGTPDISIAHPPREASPHQAHPPREASPHQSHPPREASPHQSHPPREAQPRRTFEERQADRRTLDPGTPAPTASRNRGASIVFTTVALWCAANLPVLVPRFDDAADDVRASDRRVNAALAEWEDTGKVSPNIITIADGYVLRDAISGAIDVPVESSTSIVDLAPSVYAEAKPWTLPTTVIALLGGVGVYVLGRRRDKAATEARSVDESDNVASTQGRFRSRAIAPAAASESRITSAQSQSAGSSAETVNASTISDRLSAPVWEFEPRNSLESYLACRPDAFTQPELDTFTQAELDTLAQSASRIAGLEAARDALIAKRAALPAKPVNSPKSWGEIRPSRTREALAVGIASVVVSGGLAVRDGWEVRAQFGEFADGPFADVAKGAAWQATIDGFFTYAVVVGSVAAAALAGRRWVLRKRDAEYDAQQVEFQATEPERSSLDRGVLMHEGAIKDATRNASSVIIAAEKRLNDDAWQRRSHDAGYELPRIYASASGLVYTADRGFQKSDLQYLESVDRRRCGLLIGSWYMNRDLTKSEYQLVLAGLEITDPRSASGTTRRGQRFEELTRGLSQQQIDELLIARARDRHGFIGYSRERKELVRIFDAGFRHMKIVTTGDPRPVEYRGVFGRVLTKSVGFTRKEIAQLKAEEPAWEARRQAMAQAKAMQEAAARQRMWAEQDNAALAQAQREARARGEVHPSEWRNLRRAQAQEDAYWSAREEEAARQARAYEEDRERYRSDDRGQHLQNINEAQRQSYFK